MVFFLPLAFAVALGLLGLAYQMWAFKQTIAEPYVVLGAGGVVLMVVAALTIAHGMNAVCHGDYSMLRDVFACTRAGEH